MILDMLQGAILNKQKQFDEPENNLPMFSAIQLQNTFQQNSAIEMNVSNIGHHKKEIKFGEQI